jgi:hypothetical protein
MLFRSTGRLECPDTDTANIPILSKMPHLMTPCPAGGCTQAAASRAVSGALVHMFIVWWNRQDDATSSTMGRGTAWSTPAWACDS